MTTPLTDEYLAEIEARRKAATPGKWEVKRADHLGIYRIGPIEAEGSEHSWLEVADEDVVFVQNASADIDALLAEVRRLRAETDNLESALQDAEQRADTAYTHGYNVAKHGGYRI